MLSSQSPSKCRQKSSRISEEEVNKLCQARKKSTKIKLLGPETARWGGGLPREGVVAENFVPALETLFSLGFEERNPGCPGNFAGISWTPGCSKSLCKKNFVRIFRFLLWAPTKSGIALGVPEKLLPRLVFALLWSCMLPRSFLSFRERSSRVIHRLLCQGMVWNHQNSLDRCQSRKKKLSKLSGSGLKTIKGTLCFAVFPKKLTKCSSKAN